jgi:TRAF-type zinc finger
MCEKARDEHEARHCAQRLTNCQYCTAPVRAKHMAAHTASVACSRAPVHCPNRCGKDVARADVQQHLAESCSKRWVPCARGCGRKVRAGDQQLGESTGGVQTATTSSCVCCPVACQQCGEAVSGAAMQVSTLACVYLLVRIISRLRFILRELCDSTSWRVWVSY